MVLDVEAIGKDRSNAVNLPEPTLNTGLRGELAELFIKPMGWPTDQREQELFATDVDEFVLGAAGVALAQFGTRAGGARFAARRLSG